MSTTYLASTGLQTGNAEGVAARPDHSGGKVGDSASGVAGRTHRSVLSDGADPRRGWRGEAEGCAVDPCAQPRGRWAVHCVECDVAGRGDCRRDFIVDG